MGLAKLPSNYSRGAKSNTQHKPTKVRNAGHLGSSSPSVEQQDARGAEAHDEVRRYPVEGCQEALVGRGCAKMLNEYYCQPSGYVHGE